MRTSTPLVDMMSEHALDGIALVPGANMKYLTGLVFHNHERLTLALIPAASAAPTAPAHDDDTLPCLVLPAMEHKRAQASATLPLRYFPWNDAEGPSDALRQAVDAVWGQWKWSGQPALPLTIGVEYTAMRVMELRALEHACQGTGIATPDATPLLSRLRMVKSQAELAAMTEAVRIIETALHTVIKAIKTGMTERELAALWSREIIAAGAEGESFPCLVASGPNSANPHHVAGDRTFASGDLIVLDGGAVYNGYCSDITRTVALGEPGAEQRHMYECVREANLAAQAVVRPGVTGEQVDQTARQHIAQYGYGDYFIHRTGHGLGLEIHEPPYIVAGNTAPLHLGTTFTIEPGIYVSGTGGVRIEDDVVVVETGCRSLTTFERNLIVLPE